MLTEEQLCAQFVEWWDLDLERYMAVARWAYDHGVDDAIGQAFGCPECGGTEDMIALKHTKGDG